jgi:glutathionylspermidine synthase
VREPSTPRPDWRSRLEELGFHYHSLDGVYWDESVCYRFDAAEIDLLEAATERLHAMCLEAVEHVIARNRFDELRIPQPFAAYVADSWRARDGTLFGRFDFSYDGRSPPKLLEYNADTPTSLLEAAIAQWNWQQSLHPERDQFNSLHERLIAQWQQIAAGLPVARTIHFSCVRDSAEDTGNIDYLRDTAMQADVDARMVFIDDVGWDETTGSFVDLDGAPIRCLCKLYPWEWLIREAFAAHLPQTAMRVIEPPWKMILSNKGILPILWEMFPEDVNLLPAYFEPGKIAGDHVRKPLLSREGANVMIRRKGLINAEQGGYGAEGYVYQAFAPLAQFGGNYAVIGSWIVGAQAAGIGIRESGGPITTNKSRFVPHYF